MRKGRDLGGGGEAPRQQPPLRLPRKGQERRRALGKRERRQKERKKEKRRTHVKLGARHRTVGVDIANAAEKRVVSKGSGSRAPLHVTPFRRHAATPRASRRPAPPSSGRKSSHRYRHRYRHRCCPAIGAGHRPQSPRRRHRPGRRCCGGTMTAGGRSGSRLHRCLRRCPRRLRHRVGAVHLQRRRPRRRARRRRPTSTPATGTYHTRTTHTNTARGMRSQRHVATWQARACKDTLRVCRLAESQTRGAVSGSRATVFYWRRSIWKWDGSLGSYVGSCLLEQVHLEVGWFLGFLCGFLLTGAGPSASRSRSTRRRRAA
jgi:hypothetical protein